MATLLRAKALNGGDRETVARAQEAETRVDGAGDPVGADSDAGAGAAASLAASDLGAGEAQRVA